MTLIIQNIFAGCQEKIYNKDESKSLSHLKILCPNTNHIKYLKYFVPGTCQLLVTLTLIFINHLVSMLDSFFSNIVSNGTEDNSIHTSPIYNIDSKKVEGIQLSLKW